MNKLQYLKKIPILSPLLFSVFFVVALYTGKALDHDLNTLIIPIAVSCLFSLLLLLISCLLSKSSRKGTVFSSLITVIFFSYGEITGLLGKNHIVITLFTVAIFCVFLWIRKSKKDFIQINRYIFLICCFLLLFQFVIITRYKITMNSYKKIKSPFNLLQNDVAHPEQKLPDIYYIVPDSHSSPEVLKNYYHYDSGEFINFLKSKGFFVASKNTSNYPKTFLSVTSTLNMEYLDYLSVYSDSTEQLIINPLIENNNVVRFLKSLGYKYYHIGSWWKPTSSNRLADVNYIYKPDKFSDFNEFSYALLKSTAIGPLFTKFLPESMVGESEEETKNRVNFQFEKLDRTVKNQGPKFVFIHIMSPHIPFVFKSNCEFTDFKETENKPEEENYANQVSCIDTKIEKAIDNIINNSENPPVILLQSDEGDQILNRKLTPPDNWKSASPELIKEKFPVLSAYYLPGVSTQSLYDSITPVNAFRIIFNQYFLTNLPLLPDKNYIFLDTKHYYDFKEVTDIVND